jgi:ribA/ribD-fused uncharacterized protein
MVEELNKESISRFKDEYSWLSNFHKCKIKNPITGRTYKSSEHYYVAHKTNDDKLHLEAMKQTFTKLKAFGRGLTLREDWDTYRYEIMAQALYLKFTQNSYLKEKLLATNDMYIVEGNDWCDQYFGSCTCDKHIHKQGKNILGTLLMELRSFLNNEVEDV